jgi:hypothetical protein
LTKGEPDWHPLIERNHPASPFLSQNPYPVMPIQPVYTVTRLMMSGLKTFSSIGFYLGCWEQKKDDLNGVYGS